MLLQETDTYMLPAAGCTFFIEYVADADAWRLSYVAGHGSYHYCQRSFPKECAQLLSKQSQEDGAWSQLNNRVPSLALRGDESNLNRWFASSESVL